MKRKIMTKADKKEMTDKMVWQFNTNDEIMELIQYRASVIQNIGQEGFTEENRHLIIQQANRIAFLANNLTQKKSTVK